MTKRNSVRTTVSGEGGIVLPRELRERRGWRAGTELVLEETAEGVLLRLPHSERSLDIADLIGCAGYSGPRRGLVRDVRSEARRWAAKIAGAPAVIHP